jgi:hypothetical protein
MSLPFTDWLTELLTEIAIMREKELPQIVDAGIRRIFERIGEKKARIVLRRLRDQPKLPTNIIGALEREIAAFEGDERERSWWKSKGENLCADNPVLSEVMKFLTELTLWHRQGLIDRTPDGCVVPMSIDDWRTCGRPKTWSPILDHWMHGYEAAYKTDLSNPGYLLHYLIMYNQALTAKRIAYNKQQTEAKHNETDVCQNPQLQNQTETLERTDDEIPESNGEINSAVGECF